MNRPNNADPIAWHVYTVAKGSPDVDKKALRARRAEVNQSRCEPITSIDRAWAVWQGVARALLPALAERVPERPCDLDDFLPLLPRGSQTETDYGLRDQGLRLKAADALQCAAYMTHLAAEYAKDLARETNDVDWAAYYPAPQLCEPIHWAMHATEEEEFAVDLLLDAIRFDCPEAPCLIVLLDLALDVHDEVPEPGEGARFTAPPAQA